MAMPLYVYIREGDVCLALAVEGWGEGLGWSLVLGVGHLFHSLIPALKKALAPV